MYVWKYEIPNLSEFDLEMPKGSRILHVDTQKNSNTTWSRESVWVRTSGDTSDTELRHFVRVMTGEPFEYEDLIYIGTLVQDSHQFVSHLFEKI